MEHPTQKIAEAVDRAAARLRNRRAELLDCENVLHEMDATELVRRLVPTSPPGGAKCVIVVTCRNAQDKIGEQLSALPRELPATPTVEWIVVDDGSIDLTTDCARQHGADHVIQFPQPRGTRAAIGAGVDKALALDADVIVHVDTTTGDSTAVTADELATLVRPLLGGSADCVIGQAPPRPLLPDGLRNALLAVARGCTSLANRPQRESRRTPCRAITRETALHVQPGDGTVDPIEELLEREGPSVTVRSVSLHARATVEPDSAAASAPAPAWLERLSQGSVRRTSRFFWTSGVTAAIVAVVCGSSWLASDVAAPKTGAAALLASLTAVQLLGFALLGESLKQQRRLLDDVRYRVRRSE